MSDRDFSTSISFLVDDASIQRAKKAINDTRDAVVKASEAMKRAGDASQAAEHAADAYRRIDAEAASAADAARLTAKTIADTNSEALERSAQAYQDVERAARAAAAAADSADGNGRKRDAFDSVGASGDIASATGGIRGALDALGVASDSAAGRVLELAEAAGDLGEYAPILAQTIGDLASKGGPATSAAFSALSGKLGESAAKAAISAGAMGAAGIAIAALGLAIQKFQQDAQNAQKGISEAFAARDKTNALIDSGTTVEAARTQAAQIQRQLERARDEERIAREAREQAFRELQATNGDLKARVADATGYFDAFNKRIEETSKRVVDLSAEYSDLSGAIDKGEFAKDITAVGDAAKESARAAEQAAKAMEHTTDRQIETTKQTYQTDEALLAQHLTNESALKHSAYTQQIAMAAQAAAAVASNGYRPLNTSGFSNAFGGESGGSFGGLRPITSAASYSNTSNSRVITNNNRPVININGVTNTNEMQTIILDSLVKVGLV